jgi:hypothetical protein
MREESSKKLYLEPREIEVSIISPEKIEETRSWFERITLHELQGLESMGCTVDSLDGLTIVRHKENPNPFLNRVIIESPNQLQLMRVIQTIPRHYQYIVTPFGDYIEQENTLKSVGATNTLSSTVVGKEISPMPPGPEGFELEIVPPGGKSFPEMLDLFDSFFRKPGETHSEEEKRLEANLHRGTHVVARLEGQLIAMIGTIDIGATSSIYAGIVKEGYRNIPVLDALVPFLINILAEKEIKYYYGKSRNRAFLITLRRMFGFRQLYSERAYTFLRQDK